MKNIIYQIESNGKYRVYEEGNKVNSSFYDVSLNDAIGQLVIHRSKSFNIRFINKDIEKENELISLIEEVKLVSTHKEYIEKMKPINEWSEIQYNKIIKNQFDHMPSELKKLLLHNDNNVFTDETIDHVVYEDGLIKVFGYIDYDFDMTLGKLTIHSKLTTLVTRHAVSFI